MRSGAPTGDSAERGDLPRDARAALYALLAELLTREIDAARLEALRPFSDTLAAAEPELGEWIRRADEPELAELRSEFARLFLLPGGVPPQASAWLENAEEPLADQIAGLVHRSMSALELEQTGSAGRLPYDYLGLIFSVASVALTSDVPERARGARSARRLGPRFRQCSGEKESSGDLSCGRADPSGHAWVSSVRARPNQDSLTSQTSRFQRLSSVVATPLLANASRAPMVSANDRSRSAFRSSRA